MPLTEACLDLAGDDRVQAGEGGGLSALRTNSLILRSNFGRGINTLRPHVTQRMPMSAPRRTISH